MRKRTHVEQGTLGKVLTSLRLSLLIYKVGLIVIAATVVHAKRSEEARVNKCLILLLSFHHVRLSARAFSDFISSLKGREQYPHFPEEETESQRGCVSCPGCPLGPARP